MRKAKLNLEFGARVSGLVAPPAGSVAALSSGQTFDFTEHVAQGPQLPALLVRAFQLAQSKSDNEMSRRKTNGSIGDGIRTFLAWRGKQSPAPDAFSSKLLLDYKAYLSREFKAWTAYGRYTVVARCCATLIEAGLLGPFAIPKNISPEAARAGSSAGSTIASKTSGDAKGLAADDVNEKALGALVDAAWLEAFDLLGKLEQGGAWREQARQWRLNQKPEKAAKTYMRLPASATREDCLRCLVANIELAFGGFSNLHPLSSDFAGAGDAELSKAVSEIKKAAERLGGRVVAQEVHAYFAPSKELVGCSLFLLASAQVNPESAANLKLDCLEDEANPGIARLRWEKWRAGGGQASLPFPKGSSRKAKTIPNLLARYQEEAAELRSRAPESIRGRLFVYGQPAVGAKGEPCHSDTGIPPWKSAKPLLAERLAEMPGVEDSVRALALQTLPEMTLGLARSTAINVAGKRLNRDLADLARMDGRKSEAALSAHYLRNESTREGWDVQIRSAQSAMLDWTSQPPVVLPPDAKKVEQALGVGAAMAKEVAEDELNAGMGASLVDGRVVVIDTPINALRMIQWLEKLAEAETRMLRDNPERWVVIYQPQRKLFADALSMCSKKNKEQAVKMAKEFQLPFPEVL